MKLVSDTTKTIAVSASKKVKVLKRNKEFVEFVDHIALKSSHKHLIVYVTLL